MVNRVKWKSWVTWNVKTTDGKAVHLLQSLFGALASLKLLQALADIQRQVDQYSICVTVDFVGLEKDICFEVRKCLVYNVQVSFYDISGSDALHRSTELGSERDDCHVPDRLTRLGDSRVVSLNKQHQFSLKTRTSERLTGIVDNR